MSEFYFLLIRLVKVSVIIPIIPKTEPKNNASTLNIGIIIAVVVIAIIVVYG